MTKRPGHLILSFVFLGLVAGRTCAAAQAEKTAPIQRDMTYEENLRWEASADKTITPTRVIRWMMGMRGSDVFAAVTPAEFQPIVNVENTRVRAVATIAYRF